jgi:serine/threonine protein kinase/predicted DNA-binding WGR domain protein
MIGIILRQRYKIIKQLGAGGYGETYLAEDCITLPINPKPQRIVKRLKPNRIDDPTLHRFRQEAAMLYKLGNNHDQIPKFYDYFEENREFYLVQEFIDGHDLTYEITDGKPWNEAEVIQLLQEVLEILAFVHQQGVIHRDIKPPNLMRRYSDGKLVLIDFGIVKELSINGVDDQGEISSTMPIGTQGYMPSEQFDGHPKLCSDVYAVGMMAIRALTGVSTRQLSKDPNTLEVVWRDRTQVSDALAELLNKMIRYHFSQRYPSAAEALQALTLTRATSPPPFASPLLPVKVDGKWGYIDKTGQVVIQPQFDEAKIFSEGLTAVRIGSKWGYINQTGQVIIQPQFDSAGKFYEGLLAVEIGDNWGYIDKTGQVVIRPQFDSADAFSEGLAAVRISDKRGYIDKRGEEVIPAQFDEAWQFSEGLAKIKIDNKWGYIDKTGQVIIQPQFTSIASFSEGLASVEIDNKWGYIDKTGRVVIQPQFDYASRFEEGLALVLINKKGGYINQKGEVVIQPQFDALGPFAEGLAVVKIGKQYGYIDQNGKVIIQPLFDLALDFSEGIASVKLGKNWRYIDKTGKFISRIIG